jgi:hypothetical protein
MYVLQSAPNIENLRWQSRVLLIFALDAEDKDLKKQTAITDAHAAGFQERETKVFSVVGRAAEAQRLRDKLGVGDAPFAVVLVGKDGTVKFKSNLPINAQKVFATIDAMPMRQQEMKRK